MFHPYFLFVPSFRTLLHAHQRIHPDMHSSRMNANARETANNTNNIGSNFSSISVRYCLRRESRLEHVHCTDATIKFPIYLFSISERSTINKREQLMYRFLSEMHGYRMQSTIERRRAGDCFQLCGMLARNGTFLWVVECSMNRTGCKVEYANIARAYGATEMSASVLLKYFAATNVIFEIRSFSGGMSIKRVFIGLSEMKIAEWLRLLYPGRTMDGGSI